MRNRTVTDKAEPRGYVISGVHGGHRLAGITEIVLARVAEFAARQAAG